MIDVAGAGKIIYFSSRYAISSQKLPDELDDPAP